MKKYLVKILSKKRLSWGIILSHITNDLILVLFLTSLIIEPKDGAKNGIQYLNITISGFISMIFVAAFFQVIGLILFIILSILKSDFKLLSYCDLPGNRILGYCKEKFIAVTL